jgi:uncharacterized protein YgfB (UPF0149 family)
MSRHLQEGFCWEEDYLAAVALHGKLAIRLSGMFGHNEWGAIVIALADNANRGNRIDAAIQKLRWAVHCARA